MQADDLDVMVQTVARPLADHFDQLQIPPGKFDIWLQFVRPEEGGDREILPAQKQRVEALSTKELLYAVALEVTLAVFGGENRVVRDLPNLAVRVLDRRAKIHLPGAPALEAPGQVILKVSVSRHQPGLWTRLFGGGGAE